MEVTEGTLTESDDLGNSELHEDTTQSLSEMITDFGVSQLSNVSIDQDAQLSLKRKKAGRPSLTDSSKKLKAETENYVLSEKRERKKVDYSALLEDFDDYGDAVSRKSRGRPKKLDEVHSISTSTIESKQSNEKSVARKRGRPKKIASVNEESNYFFTDKQENDFNGTEKTKLQNEAQIELENSSHCSANISKKGENQKRPKQIKADDIVSKHNRNVLNKEEMTENSGVVTDKANDTKLNDQAKHNSVFKDSNRQQGENDSSEEFLIKSAGRPIKKKRGRRPKSFYDNAQVLDSDEDISCEINGDKQTAFLNVEGLNKEHEDMRGTEGKKSKSRDKNSNSSDEELSLKAVKNEIIMKVQGRRKGLVYRRKQKKLEEKPYKNCTQMLRTVLQQSGHGSTENAENSSLDPDNSESSSETTMCMICKESMPIAEWDRHKRKVHYNLAWCTGEYVIDVHDEAVIFDNLKRIRDVYDKLECNKCGMLSTRVKDFWLHVEKCLEISSPTGMVTCAVCNAAVVRTVWKNHRYKDHNNLAWRVGEPPIDLSDQSVVVHILNKIYKERKPLTCEKCGKIVKSVIGFLSHKSMCQKTDEEIEDLKVKCQICNKMVLPVSMDTHMKIHQDRQAEIINLESATLLPSKRKAADKAMEVINKFVENTENATQIKETRQLYLTEDDFYSGIKYRYVKMKLETFRCIYMNCDAAFSVLSDCLGHLKWCEKKPEKIYVCKICLKVCDSESAIADHLGEAHQKTNVVKELGEDGTLDDYDDKRFQITSESDEEDDKMVVELDPQDVIAKYHKRHKTAHEKKLQANNERYTVKPDFLLGDHYSRNNTVVYTKTYDWMQEFAYENYSNTNLFPNLMSRDLWPLLDCDLIDSFLPKATESCDVVSKYLKNGRQKFKEDDLEFRKLELFETVRLNEGDVTIFCGGPINALAWLPTASNKKNNSQILAVAVVNDMESRYIMDCNYYEPCLIQLWDYGVLKNRQDEIPTPSMLYSIAVSFGPIWHMEWCPSGCFLSESNNKRLGLLAVAASDSFVYIFSVDIVPESQRGMIFKGKHCLKLQLIEGDNIEMDNVNQSFYATKISWTKASEHQYIAVGYTNGYVALFNLEGNQESWLRTSTISREEVLFPYLKFQPQLSTPVTALCLSHLQGGNKWLLTGNYDKDVCYWDLRTLTCVSSVKNANPCDGVWMTQWLSSTFCEDRDGIREHELQSSKKIGTYRGAPVNTSIWSPRECMTAKTAMTSSYSAIKCLSFSDWTNVLIHGSYMGEIIATVSNQLMRLIGHEVRKSRKGGIRNCLFSRAKLIKKKKENSFVCDNLTTYQGTADKYGLIFCDYDLSDTNFPNDFVIKHKVVDPDLLQDTSIDHYPLQAVNKIAFNPNPQACTFVVAGYHSGLVRIKRLKFVTQRHSRL